MRVVAVGVVVASTSAAAERNWLAHESALRGRSVRVGVSATITRLLLLGNDHGTTAAHHLVLLHLFHVHLSSSLASTSSTDHHYHAEAAQ